MSYTPRPSLKPGDRRDSKVRFSRAETEPVGTMASDSTAHGVHHPRTEPPFQPPPQAQQVYDINDYPFGEEIALTESRDQEPEAPPAEYEQTTNLDDAYTPPPARVGARRYTNTQIHRPTLDTLLSGETAHYESPNQNISPRGSTMIDPNLNAETFAYQSPRPNVRASLVMPSSPRQEVFVEGSPRDRGMRASIQDTPSRRLLEYQRASLPNHSPVIASPQFGSPRMPPHRTTPAQSPVVDVFNRSREYDRPAYYEQDRERLSPVPPYQHTPRGSYAQRDKDREEYYEREKRHFGSDATLRGDYDEPFDRRGRDREKVRNKEYRRARSLSSETNHGMRRRTTREIEEQEEEEDYQVKSGVFSQLLRITGGMRRRHSHNHGMESRSTSAAGGDLPTMKSLGMKRRSSAASTVYGGELDDYDPRVTGQKKRVGRGRRGSMGDFEGDGKKKRRASIQYHVADIITRQNFILKLAKALMTFGAPSHRIESQLSATALVLEIDAQFIHFPSIVIASFGDQETRTSETHFIKASGGLELGKLHKVHSIYRAVVHDQIDAEEGIRRIHKLLRSPLEYNLWQRMILGFMLSGMVCPIAFNGSLIDGLASGCGGILLSFLQLHVASKSAMYNNIFEISIATIISFAARGLSTTNLFCYQAVVSAGVVLVLPGYTILCASLELASKNIVSGSVRMVYSIIYSLFLGFGITIGSDLFYVVDRVARRNSNIALAAANNVLNIHGTFMPDLQNATFAAFNGSFTFSNETTNQINANLNKGSIICVRDVVWPWYRQSMPQVYLFALVPVFSTLLCLWNMQPIRSKQLPVMVFISCIGFLTNTLGNKYIFNRSDVVSAIGAFVVGVLGNVYSRLFGGTAFTSMVTGVLFLVPSGISAAGGLAMSNNAKEGDSYSQGLVIGFRMVQVAIGITVGLFGSGLLIYSFGRKKGAALFAF
ncbi:hypothetical protein P7C73_g4009, partial [Tremellales sp. Uapishka_1]